MVQGEARPLRLGPTPSARPRYYNSSLRRFLNQDTLLGWISTPASFNRFAYVNGDPISGIDPFGLDTYIVNRDLKAVADRLGTGGVSRLRPNIITHTFVVTVDEGGVVKDTYSWGNGSNLNGWSKNQPEDLEAAQDAINKKRGQWVGNADLDQYVEMAYLKLDKPENEHANLLVARNCKWESNNLVFQARVEQASAAFQKYLSLFLKSPDGSSSLPKLPLFNQP